MSHGVVCKYHYRENFRVWLTSVTVWLFFREGVAKCPCKCGSVSEIYICVGKSAFITKNGMIHRTKAVTALHHCSADYIYFETQDAYYHLSFSPFNHTTGVMQVQVLQAS